MTATCTELDCDRRVVGRGLCGTHYAYRRRHGTLPLLVRPAGCIVEGCESEHDAKGLCGMHYQRLNSTGSLEQPVATASDDARFWSKVDRSGGPAACWPWLAKVENSGYGRVWWNGKSESAHRVAFEVAKGRIPDGLTIDHLCNNRLCQNPRHLRAVTHRANNMRSVSPSALNSLKTHCLNGHEFTPENTYTPPKRPTSRHCRRCQRERDHRNYLRKQAQ